MAPLISLLAGMKAQWDESGVRILLGDNTGGGAFMLLAIRISFSTVLPCNSMRNWPWVFSIPTSAKLDLPGCTCCLIRAVSVGTCSGEGHVYVGHLHLWLSIDVPLRTGETLPLWCNATHCTTRVTTYTCYMYCCHNVRVDRRDFKFSVLNFKNS